MIKFLDGSYNKYVLTRFGKRKDRRIVARLAKRSIEEIVQPRSWLQNSFKAGNYIQIVRVMFYSSLQSSDLTMEIKDHNFRGNPSVSVEFVKFLD